MPHPGCKNYVLQNTLMTSHECGAALRGQNCISSTFDISKLTTKKKEIKIKKHCGQNLFITKSVSTCIFHFVPV